MEVEVQSGPLLLPLFPSFIEIKSTDYTHNEMLAMVKYAEALNDHIPMNSNGCFLMDQFRTGLSPMGQFHAIARFGIWANHFPVYTVEELYSVAALCGGLTRDIARNYGRRTWAAN
jgi:hypothetical protein